jgi:hypothetical protein
MARLSRRVRGWCFSGDKDFRRSTSGRWWQGECGEQACGELLGPGPGLRDRDLSFALATDDAGGCVEKSVAQGLGFGLGQLAVEAEQA